MDPNPKTLTSNCTLMLRYGKQEQEQEQEQEDEHEEQEQREEQEGEQEQEEESNCIQPRRCARRDCWRFWRRRMR